MASLVAETQHVWQINRPKTKTSPLSPGLHWDPTFCTCKSNMTAGTHDHSMTNHPDPGGGDIQDGPRAVSKPIMVSY